jgi:hypothetical protein
MGSGESQSFSSFALGECLAVVLAHARGLRLVVGGSDADPRFGSGTRTCLGGHIISRSTIRSRTIKFLSTSIWNQL